MNDLNLTLNFTPHIKKWRMRFAFQLKKWDFTDKFYQFLWKILLLPFLLVSNFEDVLATSFAK